MVGPFGYSIGPRTSYVCGCATHAVRCTLWWVVVCVRGRVVGTRASRRHGSRAAAHDQVRSACSRAVPTNVFQARNKSIYGARRSRTVIPREWVGSCGRTARAAGRLYSVAVSCTCRTAHKTLGSAPGPRPPPGYFHAFPSPGPVCVSVRRFPVHAGSHGSLHRRPHPVYSSLHADLHVWRSV